MKELLNKLSFDSYGDLQLSEKDIILASSSLGAVFFFN